MWQMNFYKYSFTGLVVEVHIHWWLKFYKCIFFGCGWGRYLDSNLFLSVKNFTTKKKTEDDCENENIMMSAICIDMDQTVSGPMRGPNLTQKSCPVFVAFVFAFVGRDQRVSRAKSSLGKYHICGILENFRHGFKCFGWLYYIKMFLFASNFKTSLVQGQMCKYKDHHVFWTKK